jgi:hypothetical protein
MNLPAQPKNSQIQTKSDFDGVTLFWKKPSGGVFRFFVVAFLIFWLCGWCVGFIFAVTQLLRGDGPTGFLAIWLAGWTLGGIFAAVMLYLLLRPQKAVVPHRITVVASPPEER